MAPRLLDVRRVPLRRAEREHAAPGGDGAVAAAGQPLAEQGEVVLRRDVVRVQRERALVLGDRAFQTELTTHAH